MESSQPQMTRFVGKDEASALLTVRAALLVTTPQPPLTVTE
jgi:hypothetical protein